MQVERRDSGIFIHQTDFAKRIVSRLLGSAVKTAKTPLEKGSDLSPRLETEEQLNLDRYPYRRALGQLLYLANCTCPDLSNSVRELGKVSSGPSIRHWRSIQHVLRYLAGNFNYGLLYKSKSESNEGEFIGFSDADFAGDKTSRKSCTGYVIKLDGSVIDWTSRTQRAVSTSTTEAEWTALHEGVRHGELIRQLLYELEIKIRQITWLCDNMATVTAAVNRGHSGRTRYMDAKLKNTRSMAEDGLININTFQHPIKKQTVLLRDYPRLHTKSFVIFYYPSEWKVVIGYLLVCLLPQPFKSVNIGRVLEEIIIDNI